MLRGKAKQAPVLELPWVGSQRNARPRTFCWVVAGGRVFLGGACVHPDKRRHLAAGSAGVLLAQEVAAAATSGFYQNLASQALFCLSDRVTPHPPPLLLCSDSV